MALSEPYTGSATISTTEISLVSGTSTLQTVTTPGIIQSFLDFANMANGDEFEVMIYEKVRSADTKRVVERFNLTDAQATPNWSHPAMHLRNGWDVTIIKRAGTDRTITWSVRSVA